MIIAEVIENAMNDKCKLSIIIPTRNRLQYCLAAVEQIVSLGLSDIQIIVQDNSDTEELGNGLKEFIDLGKVTYNYVHGQISFVDNFSAPIPLCKGEYVCMIGDDDGILPNIMDVVSFAKENDYEAVVPGLNSCYVWPSDSSVVKGGENGYLCISYIKESCQNIDPEKGLRQLMKTGGQDYQNLDLPRLYHGIVKVSVLDEIKRRTGHYFMGLTPDIYMSVALSIVCKSVVRIGFPISVSGICPKSGSADSATGRHTGELKDAPHFRGHPNYEWDVKAPAIYSVESIWGETVLHALKVFGRDDLYDLFSVMYLDGECLVKYPLLRTTITKHLKDNNISCFRAGFNARMRSACHFLIRVVKRLIRRRNDVIKYYGVHDIMDAVSLTSNHCPNNECGCI